MLRQVIRLVQEHPLHVVLCIVSSLSGEALGNSCCSGPVYHTGGV